MDIFDTLDGETAIATTFADPADVERYRRAKARGLSDQEAFKYGDNGIGKWGDDTTRADDPIVALPRDLPGVAHNRPVLLSGPSGTVVARVADVMPKRANIRNGAGIDLNPAAAAAVGATAGKVPVSWKFLDDPEQQTGGKSVDIFDEIPESGGADIFDEIAGSDTPPAEPTEPVQPQASIPHIIANAARNVPAGAGVGTADAGAGLLKVGADLDRWSGNRLSGAVRAVTGIDPAKLNQESADYLRRRAKEIPTEQGIDPALAGTLPAQIGGGFGSLIPAVASSYAAPVTIAAMMGEQGRKEAAAAGGTEAQQDASFYTNAAVGAVSEYLLGVPALIKSAKAAGIADDVYNSIVKRAAVQAAKGAGRESAQEGIQQTASNLVASTIAGYDKERDVFENVPASMLIGGLVGGPVGLASISLTPTTPKGGEQQNAITQDSIAQERARSSEEGIRPGQQLDEATGAPAPPYGAGQEAYAFDPRGTEGTARFQGEQPKADIFDQVIEQEVGEGNGPGVGGLDFPAEPIRPGPDSGWPSRPLEDQRQNGPEPRQYGPEQDAGQTGSELTPQGPLTFQPFAELPAAAPKAPDLLQARKIPELKGKMIPDGEERVMIEGTEAVIPKERSADAAWSEAHNRKSLLEALRDCLAKAA